MATPGGTWGFLFPLPSIGGPSPLRESLYIRQLWEGRKTFGTRSGMHWWSLLTTCAAVLHDLFEASTQRGESLCD